MSQVQIPTHLGDAESHDDKSQQQEQAQVTDQGQDAAADTNDTKLASPSAHAHVQPGSDLTLNPNDQSRRPDLILDYEVKPGGEEEDDDDDDDWQSDKQHQPIDFVTLGMFIIGKSHPVRNTTQPFSTGYIKVLLC